MTSLSDHGDAAALDEVIRNSSSILIGTHLNPDGDALGCALALSLYLDGIGKQNEVVCHNVTPKNLEFLPGAERIRQVPLRNDHDLMIMLDLESIERLGSVGYLFEKAPHLVLIDHHIPHHAPGDLRIVDTKAPATAVILTRILLEMGATLTPDMSTNWVHWRRRPSTRIRSTRCSSSRWLSGTWRWHDTVCSIVVAER